MMASKKASARPEVSDKRYYRIGEVSKITDVKPYVLRYWESEFRWMAPQKSRSKQRLYRKRDIEMIELIKKLLYEQRFTIAGARKKLRDMGVGAALETVASPRSAKSSSPYAGCSDGQRRDPQAPLGARSEAEPREAGWSRLRRGRDPKARMEAARRWRPTARATGARRRCRRCRRRATW
jgi:DNA-binding transcriptional MerR regulator